MTHRVNILKVPDGLSGVMLVDRISLPMTRSFDYKIEFAVQDDMELYRQHGTPFLDPEAIVLGALNFSVEKKNSELPVFDLVENE